MDDFKPEDDMKADRNDRRAGRSRQSSERDADPQINFDDVDLDADEGRPTRAGKALSLIHISYPIAAGAGASGNGGGRQRTRFAAGRLAAGATGAASG